MSFRWKDYRASGRTKPKVMRLPAGEFMRRFLLHVLPDGFHRIRHYGLFANGHRAAMLARCRELLDMPPAPVKAEWRREDKEQREAKAEVPACPCCGGPMRIIERCRARARAAIPRASPTAGDERDPASPLPC